MRRSWHNHTLYRAIGVQGNEDAATVASAPLASDHAVMP